MKYVFGFVRLLASTFLFLLFLAKIGVIGIYDEILRKNWMRSQAVQNTKKSEAAATENTKFWSFPTKAMIYDLCNPAMR